MTTIYIMLGFCCLCLLIIVIYCLWNWKRDVEFEQMLDIQMEEEIEKHKRKK